MQAYTKTINSIVIKKITYLQYDCAKCASHVVVLLFLTIKYIRLKGRKVWYTVDICYGIVAYTDLKSESATVQYTSLVYLTYNFLNSQYYSEVLIHSNFSLLKKSILNFNVKLLVFIKCDGVSHWKKKSRKE